MIVAQRNSNDGPQRRERDVILIDEFWRGDPTMMGSPFLGMEGVSLERQESAPMKKPIRFSNAFCTWLLFGGPLL